MLGRWIRRLTGVDRGELAPVLLMGSYGFLAMTSYYLVKPARNAVFVDRVGAENLPWVYLLTAVFVTLVVLVYSRHVERVGERSLLLSTFALLSGSLVFFWWLLGRDVSVWSSGAFYIWAKLYPLLLVSQFWLVGNRVFTTRQGRRVFGMLGLGLILGGIAGSALTGFSATTLGTEPLLLVAAATLVPCALICMLLFGRMTSDRRASARLLEEFSGDAVRILLRSPHLRIIAGILGLTILVSTLLDWQLNRAVELGIPTEDGMTRFWGLFFMAVNVASVAVQALVTGLVLRRWGVGVAVLVLPVGLLAAMVGVVVVPALLVVALAKGTSDAVRYSLDQSTREVLYLPVPGDTKYKVKPLIDLAVYRGGTGVGGLVLLLAVNGLGFGIREVAVLAGALILVWLAAAIRVGQEYVDVLARSIRHSFPDVESGAVAFPVGAGAPPITKSDPPSVTGRDAVSELREILVDRGADPARRRRAADLLERLPTQDSVDALSAVLESGAGDSATELRCLRSLSRLRLRGHARLRFDPGLAAMVVERQVDAAESYRATARNLEIAHRGPTGTGRSAKESRVSLDDGLALLAEALAEERERRRDALFHALALLHPPGEIRRAYRALSDGDAAIRSEALEWLEHTLDRELFRRLTAVLDDDAPLPAAGGDGRPRLDTVLYGLWHEDAPAVAALAVWASERVGAPSVDRRLRIFRDDAPHPAVRTLARELLERRSTAEGDAPRGLDTVERALLLRGAGDFPPAGPSRLLLLAERARERTIGGGSELLRDAGPGDGVYVVLRGRVELELRDGERVRAGTGRVFGPGLSPHGEPEPLGARTLEPCRFLHLRRSDLDPGAGVDGAPAPSLEELGLGSVASLLAE